MRARHRHFNPAHAGASVALDGRYGFSLSDGAEVETWEDRSANNNDATQATSASRPIYKTGIQGGQPVVRFTPVGGAGKHISGTNTITNDVLTAVCIFKINTASQAYARVLTTSKNAAADTGSSLRPILILRNNGGNNVSSWRNAADRANISTATVDTWHHFCSTFDGTNCVNRLNESTSATAASTGNFDINQYRMGTAYSGGSSNLDGDIGGLSIFNAALSGSLRKRVQFANAFSFKLSCN
jgi:hypothetical protein